MKPFTSILSVLLLFNALQAQDTSNLNDNSNMVIIKFSWSMQSPLHKRLESGAYLDGINRRTNAELRNEELRNKPHPSPSDAAEYERNKRVINGKTPHAASSDEFVYKLSVKNISGKEVRFLSWSYKFYDAATGTEVGHRVFFSRVDLKPGKKKDIEVIQMTPPITTIRADDPKANKGSDLREEVVINRVTYSDGTTWQRATAKK